MFLIKSRNSLSEVDSLAERLRKLFRRAKASDVYTLSQLSDQLSAFNPDALASALARLSQERVVDQVYRVESTKSRGGIDDFPTLASVPEVIFDWRLDQDVEVHPEMVRLLFKRHSGEAAPPGKTRAQA